MPAADSPVPVTLATLVDALVCHGLLLQSDQQLPSVVSTVVGEPVRGSWWGHPLGKRIYHLSGNLDDHPDVLCVKLVGAKDTWVHRPLWPALLAVATANAPWQVGGLGFAARSALTEVRRRGSCRADDLGGAEGRVRTQAIKDLEKRLLVRTTQFHSETGAHHKMLQTWEGWAIEHEIAAEAMSYEEGRTSLEAAFEAYRSGIKTSLKLPWC